MLGKVMGALWIPATLIIGVLGLSVFYVFFND